MGVSFSGRTLVSKTSNVGSIPTTPAKRVFIYSGSPALRERLGPKPITWEEDSLPRSAGLHPRLRMSSSWSGFRIDLRPIFRQPINYHFLICLNDGMTNFYPFPPSLIRTNGSKVLTSSWL